MSNYRTLRAANVARDKEWDAGGQLSLSFRSNELAGEVGEACNVVKKLERERLGLPGSRDTVAHLAEELADVMICADLIAMAEGIDLDAAVAAKFNATSKKVGLKARLETYGTPVMAAAKECDAVLEDWTTIPLRGGGVRLIGKIAADAAGRFPDGSRITTSAYKGPTACDGMVVTTRSGTRYLLRSKHT